jgi:hypothetical protein
VAKISHFCFLNPRTSSTLSWGIRKNFPSMSSKMPIWSARELLQELSWWTSKWRKHRSERKRSRRREKWSSINLEGVRARCPMAPSASILLADQAAHIGASPRASISLWTIPSIPRVLTWQETNPWS